MSFNILKKALSGLASFLKLMSICDKIQISEMQQPSHTQSPLLLHTVF